MATVVQTCDTFIKMKDGLMIALRANSDHSIHSIIVKDGILTVLDERERCIFTASKDEWASCIAGKKRE